MIGNDLIGKKVKLVFQDSHKVLIKEGIILDTSPEFIKMELEKTVNENGKIKKIKVEEFIPMLRILRLQEMKGGNEK